MTLNHLVDDPGERLGMQIGLLGKDIYMATRIDDARTFRIFYTILVMYSYFNENIIVNMQCGYKPQEPGGFSPE